MLPRLLTDLNALVFLTVIRCFVGKAWDAAREEASKLERWR
jgi:hypothetical protein